MTTKKDEIFQIKVTEALIGLLSKIPASDLNESDDPTGKAKTIANRASVKALGTSAILALPPGPFGMLTILPDILRVWHIQRQMVADIAAVFGKTAYLDRRTMLYCLFKHGGAALLRDVVARVGGKYLVRRATLRTIQGVLKKLGVRVAQRAIGRTISRWVPVVGAAGIGVYAAYDTSKVAETAIALFSSDIELESAKANKMLQPT